MLVMKSKYQERGFSHNDLQPSSFNRLLPLIKEAKMLRMWLFNKFSMNWYTLEEFEEKYSNTEFNNYDINNILENMVIRDPVAGVSAFHKQLDQRLQQMNAETSSLRQKGAEFEKKVIKYYQNKK